MFEIDLPCKATLWLPRRVLSNRCDGVAIRRPVGQRTFSEFI
jgi:hypothetical protein